MLLKRLNDKIITELTKYKPKLVFRPEKTEILGWKFFSFHQSERIIFYIKNLLEADR